MIIHPVQNLDERVKRVIRRSGNSKIGVNAMTAGLRTVTHVVITEESVMAVIKSSGTDDYYVSEISVPKGDSCTCDFRKYNPNFDCKHLFLAGLTYFLEK